eukprot:1930552-Prorocentrum_lima.AAC.1
MREAFPWKRGSTSGTKFRSMCEWERGGARRDYGLAVPVPTIGPPSIVSLAQCPVSRLVVTLFFQYTIAISPFGR